MRAIEPFSRPLSRKRSPVKNLLISTLQRRAKLISDFRASLHVNLIRIRCITECLIFWIRRVSDFRDTSFLLVPLKAWNDCIKDGVRTVGSPIPIMMHPVAKTSVLACLTTDYYTDISNSVCIDFSCCLASIFMQEKAGIFKAWNREHERQTSQQRMEWSEF
ncbi:uncharacterized protein LOC111453166 [Cucurbita moschata]|uniref:Uncharacterized protein LOC111453166 n=1 Tax=Cucurbita moschata TaxID=3662 RepID=A0A6J1GDD0_CUCMO|nr:uncharacterized protein LOC111453166 [Cucurbita moschata]